MSEVGLRCVSDFRFGFLSRVVAHFIFLPVRRPKTRSLHPPNDTLRSTQRMQFEVPKVNLRSLALQENRTAARKHINYLVHHCAV